LKKTGAPSKKKIYNDVKMKTGDKNTININAVNLDITYNLHKFSRN